MRSVAQNALVSSDMERSWHFLGCKTRLLPWIESIFLELVSDCQDPVIAELFAGTCAVSRRFVQRGVRVFTNDFLYSSYVIQKAYLEPWEAGTEEEVRDVLAKLNAHVDHQARPGFLHKTYTPSESGRMFFTEENAARLDEARAQLERARASMTDKAYWVALACIVQATAIAANGAGQQGAYLKAYKSAARRRVVLSFDKLGAVPHSVPGVECRCEGALEAAERAAQVSDVVYLDPPYNNRQYGRSYHLLETVARGDAPSVFGKVGVREDRPLSAFCSVRTAPVALREIVGRVARAPGRRAKHLVLSYSSQGILDQATIMAALREHGEVTLHATSIPRFASHRLGDTVVNEVEEWLFVLGFANAASNA